MKNGYSKCLDFRPANDLDSSCKGFIRIHGLV